jgi:phosphatidylglycerophosphate synthase
MTSKIAEIRKVDDFKFKKNGIIGILTRKYLACHITNFFCKTNITPIQVTGIGFLITILAVMLILTAEPTYLIIAGILLYFSKVFDSVDGQLARVTKRTSDKGAWLDNIVDRFKEITIIFAITFALFQQTSNGQVWIYGILALISVYMLSVVLSTSGKTDENKLRETHNKFFLTKFVKKMGISTQFLAIQSDTYLFITALLLIFNQLLIALMFFAIIINLYWLAIFSLMLLKKW